MNQIIAELAENASHDYYRWLADVAEGNTLLGYYDWIEDQDLIVWEEQQRALREEPPLTLAQQQADARRLKRGEA